MTEYQSVRQSLRALLASIVADIRTEKAEIRECNRRRESTPWPGFNKARATLVCAALSEMRGKVHAKQWHTFGGGCSLCCQIVISDQKQFIRAFLQHPCLGAGGGSLFFMNNEIALIRRALEVKHEWPIEKVSSVTLTHQESQLQ